MSSPDNGDVKPDVSRSKTDDGRNTNKKKGKFRGQRNRYVTPKFKGETEALQGYIYDVGINNQADHFTKTTKKIASFAGRTLK